MYPDVEHSRTESLGDSEGVDERAGDVEDAHQNDPAERVVLDRRSQTVNDDDVRHRQTAADHSERYEQCCSHSERYALGTHFTIHISVSLNFIHS